MRLGWILASIVLLALLAAPAHAAEDEVDDVILVVNESDPVELYNKGVDLFNSGKYEEALDCYNKALEIEPEYVDAWNSKGNVLVGMKRSEEALDCFDRALELNPTNANARFAWSGKGGAFVDLKRYDEALDSFKIALELDPEYVYAWCRKGDSLVSLARYDEALVCYDKALELDPEFVYSWNGKGNALYGLAEYGKALDCFDRALELNPVLVDSWNGMGNALIGLERFDEAFDYYNKALELDFEYVHAWNNKGNALISLGRFDEALACYNNALEIDSEYVYAWNGKGNALYGLAEYGKALDCYDKALELNSVLVYAWNGKGNTLLELDMDDKALDCYNRALELDPEYVYAWNGKGFTLYKLNQTEEAIEYYSMALQLDSRIPQFWYNKGDALESLNRSAEAAMAYSLGREWELNPSMKIGIFAAFIIAYFALVAGWYAVTRRIGKLKVSIVILSINLLGFLTMVGLLAGLFDVPLIGQFLAGGILMVLMSAALWSFSGSPINPWMMQLALAIENFEIRCPRLSQSIKVVGLMAVLIYATIATVFYFRFFIGSEISMVHFLELSFVSIFLLGLVVTLPPIMMAMLSKNMDRMTRDVLLIFQFGHLGISVLYLGLILWIFEIGSFDHSIKLGTIKFPMSPHFLGFMMVLFVISILGPYVSGWKRASKWGLTLLGNERTWLEKLLDVLDFPTSSLYVSKLQRIQEEIKDDKTISGLNEEFARIGLVYGARVLRLDPRFCYRDFLVGLKDRIAENIDQFEALGDDEERITELASIYSNAYRIRRDEIVGMIEREGQFKPKFWIALALIFTPLLGQILACLINSIMNVMVGSELGGLITSTPALPLP